MLLLVILIPLISSCISGLFGRFLGQNGARIFTTCCLALNLLSAVLFFFFYKKYYLVGTIDLGNWISSGLFVVDWSFIIDDITIIMLLVVNLVSSIVHLYSTAYMHGDPHMPRFMSYLSLFTGFMLILVTADNYIQLFLGWEGVGLCSYLLINFWYTRIPANKSAIKAIIVNRISDFALLFGIIFIFYIFRTTDFSTTFALFPFIVDTIVENGLFREIKLATIIPLLLYFGAVGKSAQILLHTWLPDAMEGPTPVSALIHAATMVTAGVFLIIKCSEIIEYSAIGLVVISFSGAITAFFAASSGLMQYDIKKVIAYSTCSQLGYMVLAAGLSAYNVSFFHLMNHAVFKALLFLCAGAVIHSISGEQDMRKMGGLLKILPLTYSAMFVGTLAITGFPFLTGFFSKDIILETAVGTYGAAGLYIYWLAIATAFLTAFYSFRLIYFIFWAPISSYRKYAEQAHESSAEISISLLILSFGSIFIGYLFRDFMIGLGNLFLSNNIKIQGENLYGPDSEFIHVLIKNLPLLASAFGLISFFVILQMFYKSVWFYKQRVVGLLRFFAYKWYFDKIYNSYINIFVLRIAYNISYKLIDKGLLELIGPFGIWNVLKTSGALLNTLQKGNLNDYLFYMAFGAILCIYGFIVL